MYKFKVGILGAGIIAGVMAETLNKMKKAECCCVASRDLEKAKKFAIAHNIPKAYGSYEEMLQDSEVDLVYIATPHSLHYRQAKMCIDYGKPALVEKAFCGNVAQTKDLLNYAKEKGVFITEAIWTRYQPMRDIINNVIASGIIGEPKLLSANLGYESVGKERLRNPELAGGALLDLGIYPLNFASMVFGNEIESIQAVCTLFDTGVDASDSITIKYKDGRMAVLNATMLAFSDRKGIIQGTKGCMVIENVNNPASYQIIDGKAEVIASGKRPRQYTGYEYQVEACRKAIKDNKLECEEMPHEETIRMMEQMDEIRRQFGVVYPFD